MSSGEVRGAARDGQILNQYAISRKANELDHKIVLITLG
jgi:hypothetical protein